MMDKFQKQDLVGQSGEHESSVPQSAEAIETVTLQADAPSHPHSEGQMSSTQDVNVLGIVPVRKFVLLPGVVMPVALKDPRAIAAVQHAVRHGTPIGLVMQ